MNKKIFSLPDGTPEVELIQIQSGDHSSVAVVLSTVEDQYDNNVILWMSSIQFDMVCKQLHELLVEKLKEKYQLQGEK